MADRVHPADDSEIPSTSSDNKSTQPTPVITNGTYIIQIPRDQIYRIPPPENEALYQNLTRRRKNRRRPCYCLYWTLCLTIVILVLVTISAGVMYLVFRPESPNYSVNGISIAGFNLSSSAISPGFDVVIGADNTNRKIGIYYEKGSYVKVYYSNVEICNGVIPAFFQPSKNVTVFQTALTNSGLVLGSNLQSSLVNEQNLGNIPFELRLKVPVMFKVGSVKTWKITVKVTCDITVDNLTPSSKLLSNKCDFSVRPW